MINDLKNILKLTISNDNEALTTASNLLDNYLRNDFKDSIICLSKILLEDSENVGVRMQAAIQMKNYLKSMPIAWTAIPDADKQIITQNIFASLKCEAINKEVVASCISGILLMCDDADCVENILKQLTAQALSADTDGVRRACLTTIGDIYSNQNNKLLQSFSNDILTCIIKCMNTNVNSAIVCQSSILALTNSLEYHKANIKDEFECSIIVDLICKMVVNKIPALKLNALKCINVLVSTFYHELNYVNLNKLCQISLEVLCGEDEDESIYLECLDLWSSISEIESLDDDDGDAINDNSFKNIIKKNLLTLIKLIVRHMLFEEEDADMDVEDDDDGCWNARKAATVCLTLVAQCVGDDIYEVISDHVMLYLDDDNWTKREAALLALGSILSSLSENLLNLLYKDVVLYAQSLMNGNKLLRDTAVWVISKILEVYPFYCLEISSSRLDEMIDHMIKFIDEIPSAALLLENLNKSFYLIQSKSSMKNDRLKTYALSKHHLKILNHLILFLKENNIKNSKITAGRASCLEEYIVHSPEDCYQNILFIKDIVFEKLVYFSELENSDAKIFLLEQIKFHYCSLYEIILQRLNMTDLKLIAKPNIEMLLRLLNNSYSSINFEDVLQIFSPLIEATGEEFLPYLDELMPSVMSTLNPSVYTSLKIKSLGVLSDLIMSLGILLLPYIENAMWALCCLFIDETTDLSVKCQIVGTLGDMAFYLTTSFSPHYLHTFKILKMASEIPINYTQLDDETLAQAIELRIALYKAYIMIIQGAKEDIDSLKPYVPLMVTHVLIYFDSFEINMKLIGSLLTLIGDLIYYYHSLVFQFIKKSQLEEFFSWSKKIDDSEVKQAAKIALNHLNSFSHEIRCDEDVLAVPDAQQSFQERSLSAHEDARPKSEERMIMSEDECAF